MRRRWKQWRPGNIPKCRVVAIEVAVADRRLRPPEVVRILGIPAGDPRVGGGEIHQRENIRRVGDVKTAGVDHLACDTIPDGRRGAEPEACDLGLLGGSRRAVACANLLDLVVVTLIAAAVERRRTVGTKLRAALNDP